MTQPNEHDDDLESEVNEGAAVETEQYAEAADDEEIASTADVRNASERPQGTSDRVDGEEEPEDESTDTI
jgi:hypothetical protein